MSRWKLASLGLVLCGALSWTAVAQTTVEYAAPEMTPEEKVAKGEEYLRAMNDMLQNAVAVLEEARSANDIERTGKVRDAVVAMRGLLELSEQNHENLRAALARADTRRVDSEFVKLTIAYNKFLELDAEVRSAGGPGEAAEAGMEGQPTIERQVDSDVPQLSPESGVQNFGVLLDRPPSASGTL